MATTQVEDGVGADAPSWAELVAIGLAVGATSLGHYYTSTGLLAWHELFTRLYYLPIVYAALRGGLRIGLTVAAIAAVLFLPHVVLGWHAWPAVQVGQYAEVLMFLLVAALAGWASDRLRRERDRVRRANARLRDAMTRLESSLEERLRVDRLVSTGRLATGMAHEVRNPLAAVSGAMEILEGGTASQAQRTEFLRLARQGIEQVSRVHQDLLEFARPGTPAVNAADIGDVLRQVVRLVGGTLGERGVALADVGLPLTPIIVPIDVSQLQRALVALLLDGVDALGAHAVRASLASRDGSAVLVIDFAGPSGAARRTPELFEPFSDDRVGHGLALAVAKRLIEHQGGRLETDVTDSGVTISITLPGDEPRPDRHPSTASAEGDREAQSPTLVSELRSTPVTQR